MHIERAHHTTPHDFERNERDERGETKRRAFDRGGDQDCGDSVGYPKSGDHRRGQGSICATRPSTRGDGRTRSETTAHLVTRPPTRGRKCPRTKMSAASQMMALMEQRTRSTRKTTARRRIKSTKYAARANRRIRGRRASKSTRVQQAAVRGRRATARDVEPRGGGRVG